MSPWAQALIDCVLSMTRTRFDRPIMNNIHRAEYVECLVAAVLGDEWRLPWVEDRDWAPWDLRHAPRARSSKSSSRPPGRRGMSTTHPHSASPVTTSPTGKADTTMTASGWTSGHDSPTSTSSRGTP